MRRQTELLARPGFEKKDRIWFGFSAVEMKLFELGLLEPVPHVRKIRVHEEMILAGQTIEEHGMPAGYEVDATSRFGDLMLVRTGKYKYQNHASVGLMTSEKGYRLLEAFAKRKPFAPFFQGYARPDDLVEIIARNVRAQMFDDKIAEAKRVKHEMNSVKGSYYRLRATDAKSMTPKRPRQTP